MTRLLRLEPSPEHQPSEERRLHRRGGTTPGEGVSSYISWHRQRWTFTHKHTHSSTSWQMQGRHSWCVEPLRNMQITHDSIGTLQRSSRVWRDVYGCHKIILRECCATLGPSSTTDLTVDFGTIKHYNGDRNSVECSFQNVSLLLSQGALKTTRKSYNYF